MNPCDALHHDKRAANKGGRAQCDKRAIDGTKLTTLATVDVRVIASYLSNVADFNLPDLHVGPPLG